MAAGSIRAGLGLRRWVLDGWTINEFMMDDFTADGAMMHCRRCMDRWRIGLHRRVVVVVLLNAA